MIVFGEESVRVFFQKIAEILQSKSNVPVEAKFPTDNFFHAFSGAAPNKPLYYAVALVLTTNPKLVEDFQVAFKQYALQKARDSK